MINVAVIGATGYSGAELMRLLTGHEKVNIRHAVSKSFAGKKMSDVYKSFAGADYDLEPLDVEAICADTDIAFTCLPHGASADVVPLLLSGGLKVIDLSGDFRYRDAAVYETWYGTKHSAKHLLTSSVYGLTELYRGKIAGTKLVGNPGCYTTSAILALAPLLRAGLVGPDGIIIDAKSGTSGAGRSEKLPLSFSETDENFKAYGVATHRHTSEIEQELSAAAGASVVLSFTPHLLPIKRGILSTIYATPRGSEQDIRDALRVYDDEPFVQVYANGLPEIKHVAGSNRCAIGLTVDKRARRLVMVSCIDNLIKGAAGQAVQNMNVMLGIDETTGLSAQGWYL